MTTWQRACEAALHWDEESKRSLQRMRAGGGDRKSGRGSLGRVIPEGESGDTRNILGRRFNVSNTYVQKARNLFLTDPERFEEVRNGSPFNTPKPVVYAIGTGLAPTKIGQTGDLISRLCGIQTGNPYKLQVIATLNSEDAIKLESKIHNLLAVRRLEGEWFDIDGEEIVELFNSLEENHE